MITVNEAIPTDTAVRNHLWNRHLGLIYSEPQPHGDGVLFTATTVDGNAYRFQVETAALRALGAESFYDEDLLDCFRAHQAEIERVAGSLVMLDVRADPIVLKPSYFTESPWRRSFGRA
ncbi:MAG: DUF1488 family protein [Lautropia sp.]